MVSSEIDEVLGMADRVVVIRDGRVAGELARADATPRPSWTSRRERVPRQPLDVGFVLRRYGILIAFAVLCVALALATTTSCPPATSSTCCAKPPSTASSPSA
jgi:hypothetical protein